MTDRMFRLLPWAPVASLLLSLGFREVIYLFSEDWRIPAAAPAEEPWPVVSRFVFAVALLAAVANPSAGDEGRAAFTSGLRFSATDTRGRIEASLGRDLVVRARRDVTAAGIHAGWYLEAVDRRRADSPNFLYECLCGHGPQPMDLLAWHLLQPDAVANLGPLAERRLPVWGYPYELRVRCEDCEAAGDAATDARFVKGTIEVAWRLLAESNPRQKRLADFRR